MDEAEQSFLQRQKRTMKNSDRSSRPSRQIFRLIERLTAGKAQGLSGAAGLESALAGV